MTEQQRATTLLSLFFRHASIWFFLPLVFGCILAAVSINLADVDGRFSSESVSVTAEVVGTPGRGTEGAK